MNAEEAELFSVKVACRSRMYFFDVKQSIDGSRYLSIRESTPRGGDWVQKSRLIVREADLAKFQDAIRSVGKFFGSQGGR